MADTVYTMGNLIFDRTAADVTNKAAKGYYNLTDWNRVVWFESYLADALGVEIAGNSQKDLGDLVTWTELSNLIADAETIRTAKFTSSETTSKATAYTAGTFNYAAANYVEKILYWKQYEWLPIATERRRAGTSYAGAGFATQFACRKHRNKL